MIFCSLPSLFWEQPIDGPDHTGPAAAYLQFKEYILEKYTENLEEQKEMLKLYANTGGCFQIPACEDLREICGILEGCWDEKQQGNSPCCGGGNAVLMRKICVQQLLDIR